MKKRGRHFRKETITTYLLVGLILIISIWGMYFFKGNMTGFTVYTSGPGEGQTTLILQDVDSDNLDDAYVDTDTNRGNLLILKIGSIYRTYIKFNISAIPENQDIDNATLCLYITTKKIQLIKIHHAYNNWRELDIVWDTQPCGTDFNNSSACNLTAESSVQIDADSQNTWKCWSIKEMISRGYNSNNENISMVLYTTDSDVNSFYSKDYSGDSLLIPYLNITYHSANSVPVISLSEPQSGLYLSGDLSLNYSVSDSDDNLDSCWYTLDAGVTNITLVNCANTTLSLSDGNYVLEIYTNDTLGLEINDSVSFQIDATGVSVSIVEPTGTKTSRTGISITYTVIGDDVTCWYDVKTSIGGLVIENTTLANCLTSPFSVSTDGDYVLNLYVNNSLGNSNLDSSAFSVSTSSGETVVVSSGGGSSGGSRGGSLVSPQIKKLEVEKIQNLIMDSGKTKKLSLKVKNAGTTFLNDCKLKKESSWINVVEGMKNLAIGEENSFSFELAIPQSVESGAYLINLSLECQELTEAVSFSVEVIEKQLNFELIEVDRNSESEIFVVYSLKELSGLDQEVELQFYLFDPENNPVAEMQENVFISANSQEQFESFIPIDSLLKGDLNLLINLNSETYSSFIQEEIILGSHISGFSVLGEGERTDNMLSLGLIILFFVFAFFIVKKILKHRTKKK